MKNLMAICVILFFTPFVWGQEKCEAPLWNVGDKWTYRDVAGQTWTNEVVGSEKDLYILKIGRIQDTHMGLPQNLYAFDKKTLNIRYVIETSDRRVKCTSAFREFFNFPIFIGKKWIELTNASSAAADATVFSTFKIDGIEEVSTAAGTFNAYRIDWKLEFAVMGSFYGPGLSPGNALTQTGYGWSRFWYSPKAKTWVKRKSQTGQWWIDTVSYWYKDAELISYQLK